MRIILKLFFWGSLLLGCDQRANNNDKSVKEFTKLYFDSLVSRFPNAKFSIVDDSTIKSRVQENDLTISVDNAFREYKSEPDSLQQVLSKYISVVSELFNPKEKIDIDRIVPIIKPLEYLNGLREKAKNMGATKDIEGVYEKYNDQLIIAYAQDSKSSIRYLLKDDLKTLSINLDSLRAIAARNLNKILTNIQRRSDNGVYMLTASGDYEASLILLDNVLTKENLPVNGDFVIAIPNRDLLLIAGSNDKAGIQKIKRIAAESFQTGSYQVSEYLFKWNGHKFEKFE